MRTLMKKTLLALALSSMTCTVSYAATDVAELSKELEIMSNILQTSLKQNNTKQGIRFRDVGTTYLADQGVMFEISTSNSGGGGGGGFDFADMLDGVQQALFAAPLPPNPVVFNGGRVELNLDEREIEAYVENAMDQMRDVMRESRGKLRELGEQQRELAWEKRESERRKRDLEFAKRSASGEHRKNLDEHLNELTAELKQLELKQAEVERYSKTLEDEQRLQNEKQQQARKQQYVTFLSGFEDTIGNILCRYGAGIKALPGDENISFVLSDFGSHDSARRGAKQDRIYVFKYQAVKACVRDKITQDKLLAGVNSYMF
jgi:hypothetical protein